MSYQKFISKEEINLLPELRFQGEILLITTALEAKKALQCLLKEPVLGFDTETRPAFKKGESYPPSLLQLATRDKAYLFRLQDFDWPEEMRRLLESHEILKVGVGIKDDAKALHRLSPFTPAGFVDVSYEARLRAIESQGLRALAAIFLQERLLKGTKLTNWGRKELTEAQLRYAATDAVVSLLVYEKIIQIEVP